MGMALRLLFSCHGRQPLQDAAAVRGLFADATLAQAGQLPLELRQLLQALQMGGPVHPDIACGAGGFGQLAFFFVITHGLHRALRNLRQAADFHKGPSEKEMS